MTWVWCSVLMLSAQRQDLGQGDGLEGLEWCAPQHDSPQKKFSFLVELWCIKTHGDCLWLKANLPEL
jgi:hypothetical protein